MTLTIFSRSYIINTQKVILVNAIKSLYAHYLFNQWLEFDQTSTDTSSGWEKEVIIFWWPWSYFQGHYIINTQKVSLVNAVKSLYVHYLFNKWLEFDQTGTGTSSGWEKEVIRFWWPWPYFQSKYSKIEPWVHSVSWINRWNLTKLAQIHHLDWGKKWLDFGDLYFVFKVTPALWNSNFDRKKLVCTLYLEPMAGILTN